MISTSLSSTSLSTNCSVASSHTIACLLTYVTHSTPISFKISVTVCTLTTHPTPFSINKYLYHSVYIDNVLKLMRSSHRELEKKIQKNPEWVDLWTHGRPSGTYKVLTRNCTSTFQSLIFLLFSWQVSMGQCYCLHLDLLRLDTMPHHNIT